MYDGRGVFAKMNKMNIESSLQAIALKAIEQLYELKIDSVEIQSTRPDFEGDLTIVVFPLLKLIKTSPIVLANSLGNYILENEKSFTSFNVVSGFLNIVVADNYYLNNFNSIKNEDDFFCERSFYFFKNFSAMPKNQPVQCHNHSL